MVMISDGYDVTDALRIGLRWHMWPGARSVEGVCECGDARCTHVEPHPFAFIDGTGNLFDECRAAAAWSARPHGVPLLIAGDRLDLVGVDIDDALSILDIETGRGAMLGPVVIAGTTAVFVVSAAEAHLWRRLIMHGRGLRMLPWVQIPAQTAGADVRWQVPPTSANAMSLLRFADLSPAFTEALAMGRSL